MNRPTYSFQFVSNMFVKMMHFVEPNMVEPGHTHTFDHTQVLASGTVDITVNGVTSRHEGPKLLFIRKDAVHKITSVTPAVVLCVHAVRDGKGLDDIIAPDAIPEGIEWPGGKPPRVIGSSKFTGRPIVGFTERLGPVADVSPIDTVYVE